MYRPLIVIALALLAPACLPATPGGEVIPNSAGPAAVAGGSCQAKQTACGANHSALYLCEQQKWVAAGPCETSCATVLGSDGETHGVCNDCHPGSHYCDADGNKQSCEADGRWHASGHCKTTDACVCGQGNPHCVCF